MPHRRCTCTRAARDIPHMRLYDVTHDGNRELHRGAAIFVQCRTISLHRRLHLAEPAGVDDQPCVADPRRAPYRHVGLPGDIEWGPPEGLFRDNDQLSTQRALAVFAEMQRVQPDLDAPYNAEHTFRCSGFPGLAHAAQRDTEANNALSRRIDLRFLLARMARSSTPSEGVKMSQKLATLQALKSLVERFRLRPRCAAGGVGGARDWYALLVRNPCR